jgi:hypothetical protein
MWGLRRTWWGRSKRKLKNTIWGCLLDNNCRAIVFAILYRTGFDKNELLPSEKQKIEVIQLYPHFKMGEIWRDIQFELEQDVII